MKNSQNQISNDHVNDKEQQELYFSIKLAGRPKNILMKLTFDEYKNQFKHFVKNFHLSKDQTIALKEIIKSRIVELRLKEQEKRFVDRIEKQQMGKKDIERISENQCEESDVCEFDIQEKQNQLKESQSQSSSEKEVQSQSEIYNSQIHSKQSSQYFSTHHSHFHQIQTPPAKKLFQTNKKSQNDYRPSQQQQKQQISSIHSQSQQQQSELDDQKRNKNKCDSDHIQNRQYDEHVSFQDFYQQEKESDGNQDLVGNFKVVNEDFDSSYHYKKTKKIGQRDRHEDFFILNMNKTQKSAKKKLDTSHKKVSLLKPEGSRTLSQKNQTKSANKISFQAQNSQPKTQNSTIKNIKPTSPFKSKPINFDSKSPSQKQINQQIFYRLHRQDTASFRQKLNPDPSISQKQLQDQRIVQQALQYQKQKYNSMGSQQRSQVFAKLYLTSTQSSMHKKYDSSYRNESSHYNSHQIEHVINQSVKKNDTQKISHSPSGNKAQPNMTNHVYSPSYKKRCNAHCEQFECEKKEIERREKVKQRQRQIRRDVRARSPKESLESRSKSKTKKNGQCPCCHKEKIQDKKEKKRLRQISFKNKTNLSKSRPKYSIQKLFLPQNISFISDVLQESYNELFPNENKS